jgi:hypothetical protein
MNVDNNDIINRVDLAYALGKLMGLNIEAATKLNTKFQEIKSNRELVNSLSEILEDYF